MTRLFIAIALCLSVQMVMAQQLDYENGKFSFAGTTLPYCIAETGNGSVKELAIFLHGGSACGDDNEAQLTAFLATNIEAHLRNSGRQFTIFVPQCPKGRVWSESSTNEASMSIILRNAINSIVASHGINSSRIYIFGASAGGTGSWRMLSEYPNFFAAALIGPGSPKGLDYYAIATTPVHCVLSKADKVVKIENSLPYITKIQALPSAQISVDVWENTDHKTTCINAFTDDAMKRVLANEKSAVNSVEQDEITEIRRYNILGELIPAPINGINIIQYSNGTTKKVLIP